MRFYSETNIGSRPAKRGAASGLTLKDLRAIPFAGSWSQLKQNVTGFYGVGSALKKIEEQGKFAAVKQLYKNSLFFKTLLDNCEMAMLKSYFPLTSYLNKHKQFGEIWQMIFDEYELTRQYITKLSGHTELMADYPGRSTFYSNAGKDCIAVADHSAICIDKDQGNGRATCYSSYQRNI